MSNREFTVEDVEALADALAEWRETCATIVGLTYTDVDAVQFAVDAGVVRLAADVKAEALREAADAWQQGQWADAPRRTDRVAERIANGQFVGDWLRKRADAPDM